MLNNISGILQRYVDKIVTLADAQVERLKQLQVVSNAVESQYGQRARSIKRFGKIMETASGYVKMYAVQSIVQSYLKTIQEQDAYQNVPTPSQVIFFFQRQKDRGENFAKDVASCFCREYNTLAPMQIIERERLDFSQIDFGQKQIELAIDVLALEEAFDFSLVNMGIVDDLRSCIMVARTIDEGSCSDEGYDKLLEEMEKHHIDELGYSLEYIANNLDDIAGCLQQKEQVNGEPIIPKSDSGQQIKPEYFPRIKDEYKDPVKFAELVDYLADEGFVRDDIVVKKLLIYRFCGNIEDAPEQMDQIVWVINAKKRSKIDHPGELFTMLGMMSEYGHIKKNAELLSIFFNYALITEDGKEAKIVKYEQPRYIQQYTSRNDCVREKIQEIWRTH